MVDFSKRVHGRMFRSKIKIPLSLFLLSIVIIYVSNMKGTEGYSISGKSGTMNVHLRYSICM